MSSKNTLPGAWKNILLFLAIGFLIIWVLEFRRTTLADSYWLLLLLLICLLWYQLLNVKSKAVARNNKAESKVEKPDIARKQSPKRKK